MSQFAYHPKATLYICNSCLECKKDRYENLIEKHKIQADEINIMRCLNKHSFLTLTLLSKLIKIPESVLREELNRLEEYGLVIRQYYKFNSEGEQKRSPVFYSMAEKLPFRFSDEKENVKWNASLKMEEVMPILTWNLFYSILTRDIPRKNIQIQQQYRIGNLTVSGRLKLKDKKFFKGYSHCIVISVSDCALYNSKLPEDINRIYKYLDHPMEKRPWFLIICESSRQAAWLNEKIKKEVPAECGVYYITAIDLEAGENPFLCIQDIHFEDEDIVTKTLVMDDWY